MADRIAPADGYSACGAKRNYRLSVWSTFRAFTGTDTCRSHAALMPSIEGHEIDVALSKGFREEHLHVIDKNPAICAHLKRRYRKITTYGVGVADALMRLSKNGIALSVANFDLCGTAEMASRELMMCGCPLAPFRPHAMIAVTFLRGRDRRGSMVSKVLSHSDEIRRDLAARGYGELTEPYIGDMARMTDVELALSDNGLGVGVVLRKSGRYASTAGSQTMGWGVFSRVDKHAVLMESDRRFREYIDRAEVQIGRSDRSSLRLAQKFLDSADKEHRDTDSLLADHGLIQHDVGVSGGHSPDMPDAAARCEPTQ